MALSIKDIETEQLARTLERRTGESITLATKRSLEERMRRTDTAARRAALLKDLEAIQRRWNAMPVLDGRSSDDIIGYDEDGLPSSDFSQTDIPAA
ncbi:type II toxin-antitoxin system VapB family antitoxin [Sinorhizobium meliloti]|uniref:type II toxin-antitoxin system VapB family antitoxin n=1 Tax=Rhizobium meliloti TaxID=382 RepID=UPI00398D3E92